MQYKNTDLIDPNPGQGAERKFPHELPDDLPKYRLLTGIDDATFCYRVSKALAMGYELYGSPTITHNGNQVYVAQAVLWKEKA